MESFTSGQRWYSDNEPELGLGIVRTVEPRQVQLYFPAIDEDRIYRIDNTPLTRMRFLPHDTVNDDQGTKWHITHVEDHEGLLTYYGHDEQGHGGEIVETALAPRLQLSRPQDRLLGGHIDPARLYHLRQVTRERQHELLPAPVHGLCGCRVDLVPHQLYIAHEVANRAAPRVLLADEVGLGKTIEAGLIMHKQLLDERIARVLILVPENLLHQWLVEMLRRFNLRFSLLDEPRCQALSEQDDNPFETEQLVLCPLEMFMRDSLRQEQALAAPWDLLVVDEAHHLEWQPDQVSPEYRFVEQLATCIPAVLLLTATPEQLGIAGHFARLRLLDPQRFFDLEEFLEEEALYQPILLAVNELLDDQPLGEDSRKALQLALREHPAFERLMSLANHAATDEWHHSERRNARQQLIHLLVDRHGTGRVLFRNTRAAISGFPQRQLHATALPLPEAYAQAFANLRDEPASLQLTPEQLWSHHNDAAADWRDFDPRVPWLIDTVRQYRGEKFLVICAHAETARTLHQYLADRVGLRCAVFHEEMTIIERDRAAAYFAGPEDGARLLICSEIGSEGRNFQFAHHLLMFDLPAHPDLLEQRIGRLDRIGQTQTVQIHVGYLADSPQSVLYRLYHNALDAFLHPCATGDAVFTRFRKSIDVALHQPAKMPTPFETLLDEIADHHQQLAQQLEAGRDRLLELNSYRSDEADYLQEKIRHLDNDPRLPEFLEAACAQFGVDMEVHGSDSHVMHPGTHMLVDHFPGLPDDGLTLTFSRSAALAREDWEFMSWEHPMIRGIMDQVLEERQGNAALAILRGSGLPAGSLLLECHFILSGTAPRRLQLPRFLPPTPVRRLVDSDGRDLTDRFPVDKLRILPVELDKTTRNQILRARQDTLRDMFERSEVLVQAPARNILEQANHHMLTLLETDITRLQHLATINPNVREEEIRQLQEQRDALSRHILQIEPTLDAVRLLIAG
ncbi:RNA polymerase-associated protein RapA [Thiohalophilus sp.]|uniref:RNA polymerase-associated protein RapA n=1 Tax=Thiohalophilus sp. TaxID=3028392 RepID=UPI003976BBD8